MKISEFIRKLQAMQEKFGDKPIVGGFISQDEPPRRITAVDSKSREAYSKIDCAGFFIS